MGGGGGGYFYGRPSPDKLVESVRTAEQQAADQEFSSYVSAFLAEALAQCNSRDAEGTQTVLAKVTEQLSEEFEATVGLVFGGSVAKHTYVDGLSDVDALVILKDEAIEEDTPTQLVKLFAQKLRARF